MKTFILAFLLIQIANCLAYEVTYETELESNEDCEIDDQKEKVALLAKELDQDIYGVFTYARHLINKKNKVDIVISFKEKSPHKSSLVGDMPGLQFAPFISGNFYDSGLAHEPAKFPERFETNKKMSNLNGSGRLQVFFDIGRALRLKLQNRILITAGYYSSFIRLTENNNQRKIEIMPRMQMGEFNVGVRLKFGAKTKKPLVNQFPY